MSACRDGQMGNSEVGHLNIGAGRVVMQDLPRIGDAIAIGEIEQRAGADRPDRRAEEERRHLPPDRPGVARRRAFAPGPRARRWRKSSPTPACRRWCTPSPTAATRRRNRPATTSSGFTAALPKSVPVATVLGRYYAMDRDKRWERVAQGLRRHRRSRGPALSRSRRPRSPTPMRKKQFDEFVVPAVIGDYRGMQGRRRRAVLQLPRRPRARNPRRHARSGFRRLPAQAHDQVRRRRRHGAIQRRARQADADDLPAADASATSSARSWPTPAARSCAWPRPRNIRTSPTSSTAAARSPTPARTASWCPRPRSRPTTCSRKCRRPN